MTANPAPDPAHAPAAGAGRPAQAAAGVCRTRLLADEPTGDEEIIREDMPPRKLARSIADLLRHEPRGVSIGLEGSWGAGKTSVVRLLRKELTTGGELVEPGRPADADTERTFALVVFDAWAHEKDPLRRTFLETLITRLRAIRWVRPDVWKTRHDIIAQRLEKKSTESDPRLSKAGLVAAILFLFLTPIGSALFSDSIKTADLIIDTSRPVAWRLIIGLAVMLSPALVIGTVYRRELWDTVARWVASPKGDTGRAARWLRRFHPAPREKSPSLWAMLFNKGVTAEQTRTFKTPNPTSIEFEAEFRRLMEEALSGSEQDDEPEAPDALWEDPEPTPESMRRHLVLVFDNLDRVDATDALTIWSTLQTFLGRTGERQPAWLKRLWVIVLYDPRGLRLLWDKAGAPGAPSAGQAAETGAPGASVEARADAQPNAAVSSTTAEPAAANAVSDAAPPAAQPPATPVPAAPSPATAAQGGAALPTTRASDGASTSFMDKSFQIRFEVPPPVLSDWRESLGVFLADALTDHTPEEFDLVQTVFELYLAETGQDPTFRELKLFVNQIGSLHRQWAHCCRPQDPPGAEAKFPLSSYAFYVLQRRRGVDVIGRLAEGTLISENYRELLGENPTATLAALAYNVGRTKAEQIVLEKPIEQALLLGAEGAESLAALEARHEGFWDKLRLALEPNRPGANTQHRRSALWVGNAAQALLGSGIIDRGERHPLAASVVRRLCRVAARIEEWPAFDARKAEALAALCRWKRELGVRLDDRDDDWTLEHSLLRSASASLAPVAGKVANEIAREWLGNVSLVRRAVEENLQPDIDRVKPITIILEPVVRDLKPDAEGVYRQFGHERLSLLLEALFHLPEWSDPPHVNDRTATNDLLQELVEGGHLLHHFWDKTGREKIEPERVPTIVRCLWLCLLFDPNLAEPPSTGESVRGAVFRDDLLVQSDSQVVAGFVELLDARGLPPLLDAYDSTSRKDLLGPFASACLKQVVGDHERALKHLGPDALRTHWPVIYDLVNADERPLAQGLRDLIRNEPKEELAKAILSSPKPNLAEQGKYGWLYAEVAGVPEILTFIGEQVAGWEKALHEVDAEGWRQEILNWGGLYELIFALREQRRLTVVPAGLKHAIADVARQAASDDSLKFIRRGKERLPTTLLDRSMDAEVFDQIYAAVADSVAGMTETFFDIFGDALTDPSNLAAGGFERVFTPLLKAKGGAGLRWMRRVFDENAALREGEVGRRVREEVEKMARDDAAFEASEELIYLAISVDAETSLFMKYDVTLIEVGPRPEEVMAVLRRGVSNNKNIDLLLKRKPTKIMTGASFGYAHNLESQLREAGAEILITPSGTPEGPVVSSEPKSPS